MIQLDQNATSTWDNNAIVVLVIGTFCTAGLLLLASMVLKRKEIQPLKLRSPKLVSLFLIGNICTVVLLTLVQLNAEFCRDGVCSTSEAFLKAADSAGYLIVCFSEPLVLLTFCLRYLRVRKVFDAF